MSDFRTLKCWTEAKELCKLIYRIKFPASERFNLESQLKRASASVMANIAEGCGRETTKDRKHFMVMARGSLYEVHSFLILLEELEIIEGCDFTSIKKFIYDLNRLLYCHINSLK
jgi:four helix bundle protein